MILGISLVVWSAIWASMLGFVGVIVGAWLTKHWQRNQWVLDNKRGEYREVLGSLNGLRMHLLNWQGLFVTGQDTLGHWTQETWLKDECASLGSVLNDRIFVRRQLLKSGVISSFEVFISKIQGMEFGAPMDAAVALGQIHDTVVGASETDLELSSGHRFWPFVRREL